MSCGKVSVIMGIRNCSETIAEAIDSIIGQTYKNWELILCDDASTDNTYEIVKEYQNRFPDKIIVLKNEKNMKLGISLNRCLNYSTGEFIARMDGDDISDKERFNKQVQYLETHPSIDLVGSNMRRFDKKGLHGFAVKPEYPDIDTLKTTSPFNHATIMTYKRVYKKLGGYCEENRSIRVEDYDLWFRFFANGFHGYNIQEPLYYVREDENTYKRRKISYRINGVRTAYLGCKLLGYPKSWYIKQAAFSFAKCLVPQQLMRIYHKQLHNK